MRKIKDLRLKGAFTVESAVIIPVFTLITAALIALGFNVRNNVMAKALCWKSAIELERITTQHPAADRLAEAAGELQRAVSRQGMFLRNVKAGVDRDGEGITVSVTAESSLVLPIFGRIGTVSAVERASIHNPASEMRRWHALGMITGR